jgi:hypothetical protein
MAQVNVLVSRGSVLLLCLSSSTLFCPSTDLGRDPSPYRELASHRENLIERETGSLCEQARRLLTSAGVLASLRRLFAKIQVG